MRRIRPRLQILLVLAALGPLATLGACGAAAQDRPFVVGSFPANGEVLAGGLAEIRVDYNEPVTVLNFNDVQVFAGNLRLPVFVSRRAGEPNSIYIAPEPGWFFPSESPIVVQLVQGAVINAQSHYADEVQRIGFTVGREPPVPVGHPGKVTLLDAEAFTPTASLDTPAGREAVGLLATTRAGVRRIWVQLDNGGGTGAALAWFAPGDAAMTPVALTSGGGDLSADRAALILDPRGRYLYLAYRDEAADRVRLHKIDVDTAIEVDQILLLSVPASAGTRPAGMHWDDTGSLLFVSCDDGATGTVAFVGLLAFEELDRDDALPGPQGVTLPAGAGPTTYVAGNAAIAEPGTAGVTFVTAATDQVVRADSTLVGTSVDILRTSDGVLTLEPLAGFDQDLAVQVRSIVTSYRTTAGLAVSDDLGGIPAGATDAVAMARLATDQRFLLLLATPGGRILTSFFYDFQTIVQEDLNAGIAGVQAVDVEPFVPGATVIGTNTGAYPP